MARPFHVVGMGGAIRTGSTSEAALGFMMDALASNGWETSIFRGTDLDFPFYDPNGAARDDVRINGFLDAVCRCDALVISSPVYHGAAPGLLKNAIDHLQPLSTDSRPYLTGRPVCCIAAGGGVPGAVSTLSGLRDVVHALRGWPTPMQVPINASAKPFDAGGTCVDPRTEKALNMALMDLRGFVEGRFVRSNNEEQAT